MKEENEKLKRELSKQIGFNKLLSRSLERKNEYIKDLEDEIKGLELVQNYNEA